MFDVFYIGLKPGIFPHERGVSDIDQAREQSRTRFFWIVHYLCDYADWDWLWEPPPWQCHQRHAWRSQWQKDSGTYLVPKSDWQDTNYHQDMMIPRKKNLDAWNLSDDYDAKDFDFSWHPDLTDPSYIYQFGTQWQRTGGPRYVVTGATEIKYVDAPRIVKTTIDHGWHDRDAWQGTEFDWTWHPDDTEKPYIYQFGTQWQRTGGPRYIMPGATEIKYVDAPRIIKTTIDHRWHDRDAWQGIEFDWTWHPDDTEKSYIYQFGTQWQKTGGPRYIMPGATEIKYVDNPRASKKTVDPNWRIPENMNVDSFDWTWHPDDTEPPWRYQFPTQWNRAGGPEYLTPGAVDIKFVTEQVAHMLPTDRNWQIPDGIDISSFDFSWTPDPTDLPYIYQFGTQWQKTGGPRYIQPGAIEVKFLEEPRARKISKDQCWEVPENAVYHEDFDWTWHPDDTEKPYIYQFGTQWQKTGGPRYVQPGATEVKYVNQIRADIKVSDTPAVLVDHLDGAAQVTQDQIATKTAVLRRARFVDNYLDTLRRIANSADHDGYLWICSSICDYENFDFTWHPEQWQASMLHVFASDDQKFGDTFLMHVSSFRQRSQDVKLLDWYDVNFVPKLSVPRRPIPVILHDHDSQVTAVTTQQWTGPLALFTRRNFVDQPRVTVPLWRTQTRTVTPLDPGGESVVIPRDAVACIKSQLYDYPYIDRSKIYLQSNALDIVFISHGEHGAEHHWDVLCAATKHAPNRVHRINGVTGRVAAYQAAANVSTTDWFFAVFAKLQVNEDFDWSWQPDRLQQAKHYIFHAYNPVNHLVYGHQAVIAYNRRLTLENTGQGLDFTLDQAHEVVPMVSGTAYYDNDPWTCWRTAFREALKLRHSLPDVENQYRLDQWLQENNDNDLVKWSHIGAQDAMEYYDAVSGDFAELRRSYDWAWLVSYAMIKRPGLVVSH
jgi:hypothetical protein